MTIQELENLIGEVKKNIPSENLEGIEIKAMETITFGNAIRISSKSISVTLNGNLRIEKDSDRVTLRSETMFSIFSNHYSGTTIGSYV